jgi:hypothetical protein
LAGSIFPGSNRLIFTGFSPCWGGFFVSSMGGAALVFDNLGLNLVSLVGRAPTPSLLPLNRTHGEEIEVRLVPVDLPRVWATERGGFYGLLDHTFAQLGSAYKTDPRVLAVGPAAAVKDFGAIGSGPISQGKLSYAEAGAQARARPRQGRARPGHLHGVRPKGLDGAQSVLDAGRPVTHGYHGQVLHVRRQRVHAAQAPRPSTRSGSATS